MPTKLKIQDQTFLFTGTLTEFTRDEAEALVEANGGKVLSGVTTKLNYLVVGEDAGSKLAKAKALKTVFIITEKEFLKMVPKGKALANKPSTTKVIKPAAPKKSAVKEKTKPTVSKASAKKVVSETTFEEVKIGKQTWMAKNLDVAHFRNGDSIPEASTEEEWISAGEKKQPAWCYYKSDPKNGKKYGKLYNWHAVNDSRGLAPLGYHIPSDVEWTKIVKYLGGEDKAGEKLKNNSGWKNDGDIFSLSSGNNESDFSGLPAGSRYLNGNFFGKNQECYWWTDSQFNTAYAWLRYLSYGYIRVDRSYQEKEQGLSVRCIKD